MRVLLLVGVDRSDLEAAPGRVTPVIAGCVDETVWEHETQTETDERWAPMREAYDPEGSDYEWREMWVELDDAEVLEPFLLPSVTGKVHPPDDSSGAAA